MCSETFLEVNERKITLTVNKTGLSGSYNVRVIIDDEKYETGIKIRQD